MNNRELQWKLIYSILVAGKSAKFVDGKMQILFSETDMPFEIIKMYICVNQLEWLLRDCKTGNYTKLLKCLPEIVKLDPATCTLEDLEKIHGIGPKTSRFFMLWTRPGFRAAALDTHVLKWFRDNGFKNVPKTTPSSRKIYEQWEELFLYIADKMRMTPRELDEKIWSEYSRRG